MAWPLSANYKWGYTTESRKQHFQTAPREHEDLETIARILNNITIENDPETATPYIQRNGDNWVIMIPGETEDPEDDIALREVDVCVDGQIKKMKIMGSVPY
jgi:hypothetical protein